MVKFELLQISGAKAPRFTVLLGPDDMGRRTKKPVPTGPPKPTESARRRREYWEEFLGALRLEDPDIRVPTANTLGNLWFNLRGRDLWVTVYAASSLGRIGVFLRGKPEYYGKIRPKRKQIEARSCAVVTRERRLETGGEQRSQVDTQLNGKILQS